MVTFKPYSIYYETERDDLVVHLHGRTADGERRSVKLYGTQPYCYGTIVPSHDLVTGVERDAAETLQGESVHRIETAFPFNVPKIRDECGDTHEDDVWFSDRVRYDHGIRGAVEIPDRDMLNPGEITPISYDERPGIDARVCVFDIEVGSKQGFHGPDNPGGEVLSIAAWDSYHDSYVFLLNGQFDPASQRKAMRYFKNEDWNVQIVECSNERSLYQRFCQFLIAAQPDVLAGWNSSDTMGSNGTDGYDVPYLKARAELVGHPQPDWDQYVAFDLMDAYARMQFTALESKGLDFVSQKEGLEGKTSDESVWKLYEQDRGNFAIYNVADVFLTKEVMQRANVLGFWEELSDFAGCGLQDALAAGRVVDAFVFHWLRGDDRVLPSRGGGESLDLGGGEVLDPSDGLFRHVVEIDLSSQYPNAMRTFNLSPDTLVDEDFDGPVFTMPSGARYRKDQRGIIPHIIDELISLREAKRSQGKELEQRVIKEVANSIYGNIGSPYSRFRNEYISNDITASSRELISWIANQTAERGDRPLYGDSITRDRFVTVRDPDGNVYPINIEEFFESVAEQTGAACEFFQPDNVTRRADGKEETYPEEWEALTVNPETGEPCWRPVRCIIRHETDKTIYQARQKHGITRCTEDHSLIDQDYEEVRPEELEGREMAYVRELPQEELNSSVDLADWLSFEDVMIDETPNIGQRTIYWDAAQRCGEVDRRLDGKQLENFCRLLGAYVSDGSAGTSITRDTRRGSWGISNQNNEWLEEMQEYAQSVFRGVKHSILDDMEGSGTYKMTSGTRLPATIMTVLAGAGARGKRVPRFLFGLEDRFKWAFLEEAIQGDGWWKEGGESPDVEQHRFSYCSTSQELISGLSLLLNCLGIDHGVKYRPEKESYALYRREQVRETRLQTTVSTMKYDGPVFDVEVEGTNMFCDSLGHVLLHNTDSVFFLFADAPDDYRGVQRMAEERVTELNDQLGEFAERYGWEDGDELHLELDVEHVYEAWYQPGAKKTYVAVYRDPDGNIERDGYRYSMKARGFDLRFSNTANLTKTLQREVLVALLFGAGQDDIIDHIRGTIDELKAGNISHEELLVPTGWNKSEYKTEPEHVRAARWSNENLGKNFGPGDKPLVLPAHVEDKPPTDVIALAWGDDLPEGTVIDWDEVVRKAILQPMDNVLEPIGIRQRDILRPTAEADSFF